MSTAAVPIEPADRCAGRVLVADDEDKNRRLLRDILEAQGHQVTLAENGQQALDKTFSEHPDVLLLDVMMPVFDGYQVCRQLRQDARTAHLPILLVTALRDRADRLTGIKAGANDFLTKPIDAEEIRLRVKNAVYAKRLHDQVQEAYVRLRELEKLRENLTHMIVHDMRSPLMGILGMLELAMMQDAVRNDATLKEDLSKTASAAQRLADMVTALLDVSRLEEGKMPLQIGVCDLNAVVTKGVRLLTGLTAGREVSILPCAGATAVPCDPELIERVVSNLAGNALKHTPPDAVITVSVTVTAEAARVAVRDTGPGIPSEYHQRIFEKFGQVETRQEDRKHSTGLGLTFCKLAVEAHGGQIGVESQAGQGSTFWFTLPLEAQRNPPEPANAD